MACDVGIRISESPLAAEWWGLCDYEPAVARMEQLQVARSQLLAHDVVIYLEHTPVVTYGRATPLSDLPAPDSGLRVVEVGRGGLATYHGPGQLVGYCVIELRHRAGGRGDVHAFIRALESAIIAYLVEQWNLPAVRVAGRTGVWIQGGGARHRKIASIGISVRRWVTAHGFALNVLPDLQVFRSFAPCGIRDAKMTSIEAELIEQGRSHEALALQNSTVLRRIAAQFHPYLVNELQVAGWVPPVSAEIMTMRERYDSSNPTKAS